MKRKSRKVRATFSIPAIEDCGCLYLVGRFNEWNESVYRMRLSRDSSRLIYNFFAGRDAPKAAPTMRPADGYP